MFRFNMALAVTGLVGSVATHLADIKSTLSYHLAIDNLIQL